MSQQPLVVQFLIIETSRSHSDTLLSVGLLWTGDQPDAETSIFLSIHNTHNRTSMHQAGFEPTIPASERPQTRALDRAATGFITYVILLLYILSTERIYVFCMNLRTNSRYFPIQHLLNGFYNRDAVCLLRGTDWIFKCNS